jgi:hypothetical protein
MSPENGRVVPVNLVERLGFAGLKARAPVDKYAWLVPGKEV